ASSRPPRGAALCTRGTRGDRRSAGPSEDRVDERRERLHARREDQEKPGEREEDDERHEPLVAALPEAAQKPRDRREGADHHGQATADFAASLEHSSSSTGSAARAREAGFVTRWEPQTSTSMPQRRNVE